MIAQFEPKTYDCGDQSPDLRHSIAFDSVMSESSLTELEKFGAKVFAGFQTRDCSTIVPAL